MTHEPNSLWTGGPWEQPQPTYPTPPPIRMPSQKSKDRWIKTVKQRREMGWNRRYYRGGIAPLILCLLIVSIGLLGLGAVHLWGREDNPVIDFLTGGDSFEALERAPVGTGVTLPITTQRGEVLTAADIYEQCAPSIVSIEARAHNGESGGTGVVMTKDGYVITNAHVISGTYSIKVFLHDDRMYHAKLVGADEEEDLAILKIEADHDLIPAQFGESKALRNGDMVVAIGDPLGYRTTITQGIVSSINRMVDVDGVYMEMIQTSAPINSGNSGGALINDRGQVVGITTIKIAGDGDHGSVEAIGFAIPTEKVKEVADWLIAGTPTFGFSVSAQFQELGGLMVVSVARGSGADQAGLRAGDVIYSMNGISIDSIETLIALRNTLQVGDLVETIVSQNGNRVTLMIRVGTSQG